MAEYESQMEQTWQHLKPSSEVQRVIDGIDSHLQSLSETKKYNYLHLRAEEDWRAHCIRWEGIPDGIVRDNCFDNTETIGEALAAHSVDTDIPLVVTLAWDQAVSDVVSNALESLDMYGYKIIRSDELTAETMALPKPLCRDASALIHYYLALTASQFIGNSVSSFSAMIILERWHANQ